MSSILQRCSHRASTSAASCASSRRFAQAPSRTGKFHVRRHVMRASDKDDRRSSPDQSTDSPRIPEVVPEVVPEVSTSGSADAEPSVDDVLRPAFEKSKREIISVLGLTNEEADMVQRMKYEDLDDVDGFLKNLAQENIGPILEALGITDDPLAFIKDVFLMAAVLQLSTCLLTFYGTKLGLHYETGEALRATSGLFLGYLTRPFLQVEQFLWPLYDGVVKLLSPDASYEVPKATAPQKQRAVNVIAFVVAGTFLLPQAILLWTPDESLRLALPMAAGWIAFDVCYSLAILTKCRML